MLRSSLSFKYWMLMGKLMLVVAVSAFIVTVTPKDGFAISSAFPNANDAYSGNNTCKGTAAGNFNMVIFVRYLRSDGSTHSYSRSFDFKLRPYNKFAYQGKDRGDLSDANKKEWDEYQSRKGQAILYRNNGEAWGKGPGSASYDANGYQQYYVRVANAAAANSQGIFQDQRGNACVNGSDGWQPAYAFRDGDNTSLDCWPGAGHVSGCGTPGTDRSDLYNNKSDLLSCLASDATAYFVNDVTVHDTPWSGSWDGVSISGTQNVASPADGANSVRLQSTGGAELNANQVTLIFNYKLDPRWDVTPGISQVSTNPANPKPGESISWNHWVHNNNGADYTTATGVTFGINSAANNWGPTNIAKGTDSSVQTSSHTVTQADVGTNVCRRTYVKPSASWDGGVESTGDSCKYFPYNYTLDPNVGLTGNPSTTEVGNVIRIAPTVNNPGPTKSESVAWKVDRLIYGPGVDTTGKRAQRNNNTDVCSDSYYSGYLPGECQTTNSGNNVFQVGNNQTMLPADIEYIVAKLEPGSEVCFVLSVKPWRNVPGVAGGNDWLHSEMQCVIVAKKPKLQIVGGDLKVRGSITTSVTGYTNPDNANDRRAFGSWVEYGVFSVNNNVLASSGGGLRNGFGLADAGQAGNPTSTSSSWSRLTFANTSSPYGNFTLGTLTNAAQTFKDLPVTHDYRVSGPTNITLDAGASGQREVYDFGARDITIRSTPGQPVKDAVIVRTTGIVTVDVEGISVDRGASLTSLKDIPQVVVVAGDINIRGGTTNVDAWLLATGTINTCSDGPALGAALTVNDCGQKLTVTGPVSANTLRLLRTAGAGPTDPQNPAEEFRLSADAYLWAFNLVNGQANPTTGYVTDLPPRL